MTVRNIHMAATGCSGIKNLTLRESMNQVAVQVEVICTGVTATIGSSADVEIGYDTDFDVALTGGLVKKINQRRPGQDYEVTIYDKLIKASDYFMASDNPDSPFTITNRKAELAVGDLLAQAGITSYVYDTTFLTLGVDSEGKDNPIPVNLVSPWTYIENIARMVGYIAFMDTSGSAQFRNRKPYIMGGDINKHTFTTGSGGDILEISYLKSDENTRNRVVVYGAPGIFATASGSSPYLPSGFYKTIAASHEMITNQTGAQGAADINLEMWNRLTETCTLKVIGDKFLRMLDIVAIQESFTGLTDSTLWVVYGTVHNLSEAGYTTELTLVR